MKKYALAAMLFASILVVSTSYCDDRLATVEFRLVCETQEPDCEIMISEDYQKETYLQKQPLITVNDLDSAFVNREPDIAIILRFNEEGKKKLEKVTSDNINKKLGIIIDGKLIMTPIVRQPITTGWMQVRLPNRIKEDADSIASRIKNAISLSHKKP